MIRMLYQALALEDMKGRVAWLSTVLLNKNLLSMTYCYSISCNTTSSNINTGYRKFDRGKPSLEGSQRR